MFLTAVSKPALKKLLGPLSFLATISPDSLIKTPSVFVPPQSIPIRHSILATSKFSWLAGKRTDQLFK